MNKQARYHVSKGEKGFSTGWERVYRILKEYRYLNTEPFFYGRTALELGSGTGDITFRLAGRFKNIDVVEGSKVHVDYLKQRIGDRKGVNIFSAMAEDFIADKKYDTIIMFHILEHIRKPVSLLKKYAAMLAPKGKMIIMVPNASCMNRQVGLKMGFLKRLNQLNRTDRKIGHRIVFDLRALKKAIDKSGLKALEKGGVFFKPLPNREIEKHCSLEQIKALMKLGMRFPEIATEIFYVCGRKR